MSKPFTIAESILWYFKQPASQIFCQCDVCRIAFINSKINPTREEGEQPCTTPTPTRKVVTSNAAPSDVQPVEGGGSEFYVDGIMVPKQILESSIVENVTSDFEAFIKSFGFRIPNPIETWNAAIASRSAEIQALKLQVKMEQFSLTEKCKTANTLASQCDGLTAEIKQLKCEGVLLKEELNGISEMNDKQSIQIHQLRKERDNYLNMYEATKLQVSHLMQRQNALTPSTPPRTPHQKTE